MPTVSPDGHHGIDPTRIATREDFREALTVLREGAGLTVREVARTARLPGSTLGGYFGGRHLPPLSPAHVLVDLLAACGVTDERVVAQWRQALSRVRRVPGPRPAGAPVPYRGLASFQPEDADWFHGREALTALVVERLAERYAAGGGVVPVVGASGAGKSSLLRAGVIPALRAGAVPGVESCPVVLMTPGPDPLAHLREQVDRHRGHVGGPVVVVDQLEELFTPAVEHDARVRFVELLAASAAGGALILLGLRADHYGPALAHPRLARALQDAQVVVTPMTEEELRRAITEPARLARVDIEEGLVDLLLADMAPNGARSGGAHEPGALPLLSHALLATWEHGQQRRLTIAGYRAAGGLRGAVAQTAESVYASLADDHRHLARDLFLRLVRVSADGPDTRRRVPRQDDLVRGDDPPARALAGVLATFVDHRLVTAQRDTVEISHEVLLDAWPRLRGWIDTDRAGLLMGQQVLEAAQVWDREHRDAALLYRGSRLATARQWLAAADRRPPAVVRDFLAASSRRERRGVRRLYQTVAALAALLAVTVAAGVVAAQQRSHAVAQERVATEARNQAISRLVATRAERLRDQDASLAAQLSLAAYQISPTTQARSALIDSSATHTATRLLGSTGVMQSVALSPDHRLLAAGTADGTVLLWDFTDPYRSQRLGPALTGPDDVVYSVAFSPDGRTLAAGGGDHRVHLWDMTDPDGPVATAPLAGPEAVVYSVAFSPDGRTLAAGSADRRVHLWDMGDGPRSLGTLAGAGSYVQAVAFGPGGRLLAAGSDDTTVRLWDVRDPTRPAPLGEPLTGPTGTVFTVAFSPDEGTLAAGSRDGDLYLWDISDPARPEPYDAPLTGASGWVQAAAFSPDGGTLAAASSGQAWLWDWRAGRRTATLPHSTPVTSLTYADDADTLVTAAADGTARVWHLPGPALPGDDIPVNNVRFSPDGATLAVAGGETRLWGVDSRVPLGPPVTNPTGYSGTVAFLPDGDSLVVTDRAGDLWTWDISDPARPAELAGPVDGHPPLIEQAALSPDGVTLATGGDDNMVRLWDLTDPRRPGLVAELAGFRAYVYSVQFSPDGRLLAAASVDDTVRIWDVSEPARPVDLSGPLTASDHYVLSVAFHPDQPVLAVGSADKNVYLWDISDPRRPARVGPPMVGPTNYVYALDFHPDGTILAAASTDETLWLWNVTDPHRPGVRATLTAGTGPLYTTVFSPDGATLAAAGGGNTVWLWTMDPVLVAQHICRTAGDRITPDEWRTYVPDLPYRPPC